MAKTEESKLEQEVEKFMREKRIWQLARFQAQYNQNGLPDRLYLYKGLLLGLELKTDKGCCSGTEGTADSNRQRRYFQRRYGSFAQAGAEYAGTY